MPQIRMIVIEGDLSVEEAATLASSLGRGAVALPPSVTTAQEATLRTSEPKAKPAPKVEAPAPIIPAEVPAPPAPPTSAEVIQQTLALDSDLGPAPVVRPDAPPPAPEVQPEPAPVPSALAGCRKLRDVLEALRGQGLSTAEALVAECQRLRAEVPILARIAADQIDERVRRTLEGMA